MKSLINFLFGTKATVKKPVRPVKLNVYAPNYGSNPFPKNYEQM